jgi:hypothetical protein
VIEWAWWMLLQPLNSDPRDVAILQQQRTSLQQPEIVGNTNINNKSQSSGGKDDERNLEEVNKDNMMPRDGQLQQY